MVGALAGCPASGTRDESHYGTQKAQMDKLSRSHPPPTRQEAVSDTLHGVEVLDPYRWLENVKAPEVQGWMASQDRFTRGYLEKLPNRKQLRGRLNELSYIDTESEPIRRGKHFFYSRQHRDKEKRVYYWRPVAGGKARVLIDPNKLSDDGSVSIKGIYPSWDGQWVAFKLSENNADAATLHLMRVESGERSRVDSIPGAKYANPSWTPEGKGFYYTRLPVGAKIPISDLPGHAAVYFHMVGQPFAKDPMVHPATGNPSTFISADLSRDGRSLVLYKHHGWTSTDVYIQHISDVNKPGRKENFLPFRVGIKALYGILTWGDHLYVHTNEDAPRYRLFKVTPPRLERESWKELIPERKSAVLDGVTIRGGRLALRYMERATSKLEIADLEGNKIRDIPLPELGTVSDLVGNPEDDTAYFSFTSFLTPTTIFKTSLKEGGREVHFKPDLELDTSAYTTEQMIYKSRDGTPVSMFIVRKASIKLDGSTPFILTGYGGFNINLTPQFRGSRIVWLEQGGALAIPNLRGGGEYGEKWHQDGMLLKKQNVFDDFIAAAEHLIEKKYTRPNRLAIVGGSNGGLLVGAAMTQRPELFKVVGCHVPLLDMIRYHLFGSGKTWISEYGSADDPEQFKAILAYSPYQKVKKGTAYPSMIMMSADSDDRVDPMHARKFTAAIQNATKSKNPVLFRLETNAGHGGGDMVKKRVEATVDEFSFLMQQLGMKPR